MKNKYLSAWIIPLLLLGVSCKKQEKLSQDNHEKQIQKSDLIGTWTIVKTEITGPTKNGIETVVLDTKNSKSHFPDFYFSTNELGIGNTKNKYSISAIDKQDLLIVESRGVIQNYKIAKINELIQLKFNESTLNLERVTTYYLRKTSNETL